MDIIPVYSAALVSLIQAQAIVVSLIAATIAIISYMLEGNKFNAPKAVCLVLAASLTASVCSFVLASMMVGLAILARKLKINPDNIATPLAAATGDVSTLSFLVCLYSLNSYFNLPKSQVLFGTILYKGREEWFYYNCIALVLLVASTTLWMYIASRQYITLQVLKFGWFAVLAAMCISR